MIDFEKATLLKLARIDPRDIAGSVEPLIVPGEQLHLAFKTVRDFTGIALDDSHITLMHDRFCFAAPFGPLGHLVSRAVLASYMRNFLLTRNRWLKASLEKQGA